MKKFLYEEETMFLMESEKRSKNTGKLNTRF